MRVVGICLIVAIGCSSAVCASTTKNAAFDLIGLPQEAAARPSAPPEKAPAINIGKPGGPRAKRDAAAGKGDGAVPKLAYEWPSNVLQNPPIAPAVAPTARGSYQLRGNTNRRRSRRWRHRRHEGKARRSVNPGRPGGPRKESPTNSNKPG